MPYRSSHWSGTLQAVEIPVYGAGKIGTFFAQADQPYTIPATNTDPATTVYPLKGNMAYELTDHLGNVRALVRDNTDEYTATMEDDGTQSITNPRIQEMQYYKNLFETEMKDPNFNHTTGGSYSAYLNWISGKVGMDATDKGVGPALALKVEPGDQVQMETWVRFANQTSFSRNMDLLTTAAALGSTFAFTGAFETFTAPQVAAQFQGAMTTAGFFNNSDDDTRPYAYLNYLVMDKNMAMADAGWLQVPLTAGFNPGEEGLPNRFVKLSFNQPITINTEGYLYVWVSNESEGSRVWFDDTKVTHKHTFVGQASDYGPWGDVIRQQQSNALDKYRFGYQGRFAEKDDETGWNHFELREFDPAIGRWMTTDPAGQYWSPYIGMGNNPVSGQDPTGGFDWVQNADGQIYWDSNATSQETTKAGETYIGRDLTFTFNSFIDAKLWDGPMGDFPTGDKLTSTIQLTSHTDSKNNLLSVDLVSKYDVAATGGIFQGKDYVPGQINIALNVAGMKGGSATFEQHAMVNGFEETGLNLLNYDAVNVAQKLTIGLNGNRLSISAGTDIFPSATLSVNEIQLFIYSQPSFIQTHGRSLGSFGDNGMSGVTPSWVPNKPSPSFYQRYSK